MLTRMHVRAYEFLKLMEGISRHLGPDVRLLAYIHSRFKRSQKPNRLRQYDIYIIHTRTHVRTRKSMYTRTLTHIHTHARTHTKTLFLFYNDYGYLHHPRIQTPRSLLGYLDRIEEQILESKLWEEGSPLLLLLQKDPALGRNLVAVLKSAPAPSVKSPAKTPSLSQPGLEVCSYVQLCVYVCVCVCARKGASVEYAACISSCTGVFLCVCLLLYSNECVWQMIARKVAALVTARTNRLCEALEIPQRVTSQIWGALLHVLFEHSDLLRNRHVDTLLLCCVYGVARVNKLEFTFRRILERYRMQPQAHSRTYRDVPTRDNEKADIIKFYNQIFIPKTERLLMQLELPPANSTASTAAAAASATASATELTPAPAMAAITMPAPAASASPLPTRRGRAAATAAAIAGAAAHSPQSHLPAGTTITLSPLRSATRVSRLAANTPLSLTPRSSALASHYNFGESPSHVCPISHLFAPIFFPSSFFFFFLFLLHFFLMLIYLCRIWIASIRPCAGARGSV